MLSLCEPNRLDLVTKVWEIVHICRASNMDDPKGRYRHEIAYDDHYIYVLGGGTSEVAYDLENLPAFDLKKSKWITIKTKPDPDAKFGYPQPRKCHSCIQYDTPNGIHVIIAGGYIGDDRFFDDVWRLNLRTYQWQYVRFSYYYHE